MSSPTAADGSAPARAVMWFDYICPWAYLGRDRTALLRELGVEVRLAPFELHPEVPREGAPVRPGGRLDRVFDHIGAECAELGMPFRSPTVSRNSRLALETGEVARVIDPDRWASFDAATSRAYWAEGADISSWAVLAELLEGAGLDPGAVHDGVADGTGAAALRSSMTRAREQGVTATPAWLIDDTLLIPGAQPRDTMRRWVTRLLERRHS